MKRPLRRTLAVACGLALAAPAHAHAASSGRLVEIHVDGDPADVEQVRLVATELLAQVAMAPVVLAGAAPPPSYSSPAEPFVRAYFDFRSTPAMLVIVDGSTSAELERRSLSEGAQAEASVESAAHVLFMVVESLLDRRAGADGGIPNDATGSVSPVPDAAEGPALPPDPAPSSRAVPAAPAVAIDEQERAPERGARVPRAVELEVGLLGRALYLGEGWLLPGVGIGADLGFVRTTPLLGLHWSFAAHSSMTLATGGASAKLTPISVTMIPTLGMHLGSTWTARLGVGVDWTWFSLTTEGPPGVTLGRSAGGLDTTLAGVIGVRARLSPRWSVTLMGAIEYDPAPREFVAFVGDERQVLATLPVVRPFVSLLAAYSLLGPSAARNSPEAE